MKHLNFIVNRICANTPPCCSKRASRFVLVLVLMLTIGIGQMWGVDFSFSSAPTGWPSSSSSAAGGSTEYTYTVGTTSYSFLLAQGCYVTSSVKLYHPKSKSTGLPALSGYKLTRVVGVLNDSGSPSTKSEVSITTNGSTVVSGGNKQTWSTKGGSYTYDLSNTSANTRYYLTVSSTANCQIKSLALTYTSTGGSTYTITYVDTNGEGTNGSYSASSTTSIASGATITLSATPADCYELNAWDVYKTGASGTKVSVSNNQFTMPAYNVTVGATFQEKGAGKTVNFDAQAGTYTGGSLSEDCAGEGITLPAATASGICKGWTTFAGWATEAVTDSTTKSVTLYAANSKFYPTSNGQTLYAVYSKVKSGDGASWTLSSSAPTTGDSIIVAYYTGSAYKYMKNSGCDNDDLTVAAGVATPVANGKFKVVAGASNGVSFQSGSNYMHLNSSNLNVTSNQTNADLNISAGTSANSFLIKRNNSGSLDRVLKWTGTNWTSSSTMSEACEVYFFKRTTSTTYYCSDPNCCTKLGSINGSFTEATQTGGTLKWTQQNDKVSAWTVTYKEKGTQDEFAAVSTSATTTEVIETITYNKYTITGLQAGRTYQFKLHATLKDGVCTDQNDFIVEGPTLAAYEISAVSNNTDYGTVSLTGTTITATPAAYCRYATVGASTVTSGTATVVQGTGEHVNEFTVTPSSDCTVRINFEPIPVTGVTMSSTAETLEVGGSTTLTAAVAPNTANPGINWTVTQADDFISFNTSTGAVSALKAGTATITATSTLDNTKTASCTVTVVPVVEYKKVTANLDDWSGEYLLVCEKENNYYVYTGVDQTNNGYVSGSVESGKMLKPEGAVKLNVAAMTGDNADKYSIQVIGGTNNNKYIGQSSNANGINFVDEAAANEISLSDNVFAIKSAGGAYLRFNATNTEMRFRYYKSSTYTSQQPVQLYKKVVSSAVTITDPATGTGSLTLADGQTAVASGDNIEAGTQLTVTATPNGDNHYIGGTIVVKKTSDNSDVPNSVWDGTTLTMPEYAITVSATFTPTYAITGASVVGGSFSWEDEDENENPAYVAAGVLVQASANAANGYVFDAYDIYQTGASATKVSHTNGLFTMPAYAVTIGGSFNEAPTITLSQTSTMAFSKVATETSTSAKFTVNAANLTAGSLNVTKSGANPDKFNLSVSSITVTAGAVTDAEVTVTPITTAAGDYSATITVDDGDGGAAAQSFNVTLHVEDQYTINWYVNGTEVGNRVKSQEAFANDDLDIPNADDLAPFTDCSEFIFLGWKDGNAVDGGSSTSAPTLADVGTKVAASKNYYAVFGDGSPEVDESDSWDLTSTSAAWTGSKTETYFTKPYGMKKENAYIVNNSISDFENYANDADEISITVKCFQNDGTTSRLTVYLVDENGAIITGTGKEFTPTNGSGVSSAADSEVTYSASDVKDKNATGYVVKCTTYDKGILITGTSYQITKAESYSKYYTTCPQIKNVVLSAATVSHGSISFKVGGKAATSARTDEDDVVVDIIASPETGYELTGISLSSLSGASYNSTTKKIELEQNTNGTLTVTAEFTQKNYSVAVQTYPASIGAELTGTTSTAKYGVEQTISTNEPAGYIFRYWYLFDASTFDADNIDWDADLSEEIFTGTYEGEDFEMEASFEMQDKNLVAVAYFNRIYTPAQALELTNLDDSVFVEGIISQVDEVSVSNNNATYWISADGSTTNQLKIYRGMHLNKKTITTDNKDEIAEGNRVIVRGKLSVYSNTNQFGSGASYIKRLTEKELSALEIVGTPLNVYKPGDSFNKENLSLTATYNTGYIVENYTGTTISSNYDAPNTFSDLGSVDVTLSASETPSGAAEAVETSRVVTVTVTNAILDHVVIASSAKTSFWLNEQYKEPKLDAYMDDGETVNYNVTGTSNTTGLNMGTTGDKSVTVSYTLGETKSTTYNFTVNPIAVEEANAHSVATARDIIDVDNDENENLDLANAANKTHVIGKVTSVEALSGSKYTIVIKDIEDATKVMTLYKVTLKSGISSVVVNDVIKAYGNLYYHTSSNKYEINEGGQVVWKQPKVDIQIANKTLEVGENWTIDATITPAAAPVTYSIKVGSDACITLDNDEISATAAGTATIIASAAEYSDGVNSYAANSKEFTVTVLSPAVHTSVVILAEHNGTYYALNNSAGTTTVEMNSGMVVVANEATKDAIIWDCAERDGVATFYNAAANKYLQGGTTTTLGTTTTAENYTQWTWVETTTKAYYTANPGSSARSFIYQNGQGIKNYAVSNIENSNYAQAKVLAKKVAIKVVPEGNDPVTKDEDDVPSNTSIVVSDKVTLEINNVKTLDNLTVEAGGKVTGSATLNVQDLTIKTSLGTISGTDGNTNGKSGQISGSIEAMGDVYIQIELTQASEASYGWYAFSVPFRVDAMNGVYYGDTKLTNEVGYAIMAFHEDKYAAGEYAWKKYRDIMEPGKLYIISVGDTDYKTLRFKKVADAPIIATSNEVELARSDEGDNAGWNGVGNPNLQVSHQDAISIMQFLDHEDNSFIARSAAKTDLMVGTAFMIQRPNETSSIEIKIGGNTGDDIIALAPTREPAAIEKTLFEAKLTNTTTGRTEDNLYFTAREDATNTYEAGRDVTKLSMGSAKNAQMTISAYGKQLCAADFPLVNGQAEYPLVINTPKAGNYSISTVANANADIYLTYEGSIIWNLSMGAYEIDLNKGTTNGYGLLLQAKAPQVVTGVEEVQSDKVQCTKVVIDDHVYILRGGQLFGIDGKAVK